MYKTEVGTHAGIIWHALNEAKEITIKELSDMVGLSIEDTAMAVGWLARENKIFISAEDGVIRLGSEDSITFSFG